MISRLLSLTLIAAIFDCPMLCGVAPTVCALEVKAVSCCGGCHWTDKPLPTDDPSAPTDNRSQDGKSCCQCVCNGAVVEVAALPSFGIDLDWWAPVPATTALVANASQGQLSFLHAAHQPDDGMNPGRAMRCLFVTFLC